jgi:ubiquinone/menaquinone biosynthesis C-methylase UbiE
MLLPYEVGGMNPGKADYSQIAEVYDEVRKDDLPHIVWWQTKIALEGKLGPGKRFIDLGCGTGRWTIPLARRTGCEAVGLDSSEAMLARARAKDGDGRVAWVRGDCESLGRSPSASLPSTPLGVNRVNKLLPNGAAASCAAGVGHPLGAPALRGREAKVARAGAGASSCRTGQRRAGAGAKPPALRDEAFDCALMSLMMHHLEDHLGTFRGVFRILRPGGVFLIRQGTLEDILRDPMHRFFPEVVTIDRKRTPFRSEIERWLGEAGFNPVRVETFKQHTYSSNMRLLEEVEKRVSSALRMIGDEAFGAGLARFKAYLRRPADDPSLRDSYFTLFIATKPRGTTS